MVATAVLGSGALSAGASIFGASSAADAQRDAASQATQAQTDMFNTTRRALSPYIKAGKTAAAQLTAATPGLIAPISMTQNDLMQTPGYQFNLSQGLKSTQSGATARGLGVSGAADKAAATYATGLADSTYQNQFNNALENKQNTYNVLSGQSTIGANAAAGLGTAATATGTGIASNLTGAGNATAASYMAMANGIGSGLSNATGAYLYGAKNNLFGNSLLSGKSY